LIAVIPLRSPARGETAKMPMIAVMIPMTGMIRPSFAERGLAQDQRGPRAIVASVPTRMPQ